MGSKANAMGCATLHQGGIVQTREGEWWGFSMQDFRAVGRTTSLSPITWEDGWPYFGLPGNLGRTPRTWIKPKTTIQPEPHAPYQRSDNFDGKVLQPIWQWNIFLLMASGVWQGQVVSEHIAGQGFVLCAQHADTTWYGACLRGYRTIRRLASERR